MNINSLNNINIADIFENDLIPFKIYFALVRLAVAEMLADYLIGPVQQSAGICPVVRNPEKVMDFAAVP